MNCVYPGCGCALRWHPLDSRTNTRPCLICPCANFVEATLTHARESLMAQLEAVLRTRR